MTATPEPTSSRIAALMEELEAGDTEVLDAFWARLETEGTPIVEPLDGDPDFRALTFVWRDGREDTRDVVVEGGPASGPWQDHQLARVNGTDLWFKTYRVRADLRGHYQFSRNAPHDEPEPSEDGAEAEAERVRPPSDCDPLNPNKLPWTGYDADADDRDTVISVIELPGAPPQPWAAPRPGVKGGQVEQHTFKSEALGNERRVWVYRPPVEVENTDPPPVMVLLDGWEWNVAMPIAPTFDNLIAEGAIPPLVVVMPESLDHKIRGLELPCHEPFVAFLADELLPWARDPWGVTTDPARTIMAGQSYGGLASTFAALQRPDVFGNVVSQSGSFWWKAGSEFDVDAEYLVRRFAVEPRVPVRFWLEVGLLEGSDMMHTNRHLRDVLEAKGYDFSYTEFNYDHWWPCWRGTLPDALRSITRDWGS